MKNSNWLNAGGPVSDRRTLRAEDITPPPPVPPGPAENLVRAMMRGDAAAALTAARELDARLALLEISKT